MDGANQSGPLPMAISKKPDGSTDKVFAQDGTTNSFFVVDFDTHVVSSNVKLPDIAPAQQNPSAPPVSWPRKPSCCRA
jgi:hypothetical protein